MNRQLECRHLGPETSVILVDLLRQAQPYVGRASSGPGQALSTKIVDTLALIGQAEQCSPAVADVLAERQRQIHVEGFSLEHDDEHHKGELAIAAACYAEEAFCQLQDPDRLPEISQIVPSLWPWEPSWWKPSLDARKNLVKASALTMAAIGVIDRAIERELLELSHD
ncbi:hypothetical protein N7414_15945 [Pseudomonas sp. GD04087]|uniref:hypothetical protein n=1 Tax=unclassified Pseudomonas TaxID=196821 RepID=UPI00244CC03B|nr:MULTISPECIES: hypothetical protein [unclassified Pseudomonas]MDH0290617.1 hypothetical protein [Pseudomonas sp. GD04087]MDH1051534.1 hypothetical protein [Pseudomonas sp. GD03903]MDH2002739.1 hypothetical protein [Pseudomonas sp. GD03691]